MAENVPVICPTSQAKVPATNWHDGQITSRAKNIVNLNLVPDATQRATLLRRAGTHFV
jgi:hypothetical protein